ncbi:MAG: hypothetical protein Q9178_007338 [Gyalolechia marmorata]
MSYRMRPPPTDEYYDTHDELFAAINQHARREGYAVFKKRTKSSNKRGIFRVTFQCVKGKMRASESNGYRESSTAKCNCPFQAYSTVSPEGWRLQITNGEHNHSGSYGAGLRMHRKNAMTEETQAKLKYDTVSGARTGQLFSALRNEA